MSEDKQPKIGTYEAATIAAARLVTLIEQYSSMHMVPNESEAKIMIAAAQTIAELHKSQKVSS